MALRDTLAQAKNDPRWACFRRFCDQARRPSRDVRALDPEVLGTLPRVAAHLSPPPRTPDAWTRASRAFLDTATRELLDGLDRRQLRASPLWVVRQNNVHGEILDALVDRVRSRRGRPYGIEQIKKMKQAGIGELFRWAQRPEAPARSTSPLRPALGRWPARRAGWLAAVAAGFALIALGLGPWTREEPVLLHGGPYVRFEHHALTFSELGRVLGDLGVRMQAIPQIPFSVGGWYLVPPSGGEGPRVLFIASRSDPRPGAFALWDPRGRDLSWVREYTPARSEIRTHATLENEVYRSPFTVGMMVHGRLLPDRIGISLHNDFSPAFFLQVRVEDGRILSRYVHPGRLESGLVTDIDGDGSGEFVLLGQENVRNRPVLVVLGPMARDGEASTVMWRDPPGQEDARLRVLLPGAPLFEAARDLPRLRPGTVRSDGWTPSTGILHVPVVGDGVGEVYELNLDRHFHPVDIVIGESAARTWARFGVQADDVRDWLTETTVIPGTSANAGTAAMAGR